MPQFLLPPGKFPRFAMGGALLFPVLLALGLTLTGPSLNQLISNGLDLALILLAFLSCIYVARKSSGYVRQLWLLLSVALGLAALAQGLTTYYQSFARSSLVHGVPSDIMFFLWAAPVFMIFLPPSGDGSRFDWLRLLDFLQVAVVALTAYLYLFYFTSRWNTEPVTLVRSILIVYAVRDLLLSISFFSRSRTSHIHWLRRFCLALGIAFLASVSSNLDFLFNLNTSLGRASWGDLLWMLPYLIILYLAITWRQPQPTEQLALPSRTANFVGAQLLPVALPLLVIFMSRTIAQEQFVLAWLAVTVSVLCASVRLILTNRIQRRTAEDLLNAEKALRVSEQLMSTAFRSSPDSFSINVFPDGPYVDINESFTRLSGYTREETLGKTPSEMKLWADPSQRSKLLEPLSEGREVRDLEISYSTKSGEARIGLMSACLIQLREQRCSLVVVRDITARKQAEDLVRTSEERFRSLVQKLHVGIITYDPQARITFANQSAIDRFGLSLDQIIGKKVSELGFHPINDDGTVIPDDLRPVPLVIASRQPINGQLLAWRVPNRPDPVWTLLDAVPEFNSAGEITRIVISFTDVTEQRRAVAALRESEQRFRTLVQHLHAAVILHRSDGRVSFANPAAERLLELPDQSAYLGKLPSEIGIVTLSEQGRVLSFDERPVSTALRTGAPIRDVIVGLHLQRANKTVWVYGSSVPHIDESGDLIGTITSFIDITEQRRANDALRESEERFRTLVRDLHVGVALHRPDGSIEFANPAAYDMFGLPQGSATGKFPGDLGIFPVTEDGKDIPLEENPVYLAANQGISVTMGVIGLRHPKDSGRIVWVFGNVVPQRDPNGKVIRTITSFADITEMRNAQQAVRRLSTELLKLQDEERRRIGRELHDGLAQTVLAINLNLAQARQCIDPRDQAAGRALDKARSMTQQMSSEIRTLSYLLHPPLLDDLGLLSALKEYVQGFAERSGIQTSLEVLSSFGRLPQAVELALFRVVQESLGNVQKHSGSASAVIRLSYQNAAARLEVVDFGHGMILPSNGAHDPKAARLGVGIPGMRERVAQLGGQFHISSTPAGTTIHATIPVSESLIATDVSVGGTLESDMESR